MEIDKKSFGLGLVVGAALCFVYIRHIVGKSKNSHNPAGVDNTDNQIKGVKQ